jgi:hypothetical protein
MGIACGVGIIGGKGLVQNLICLLSPDHETFYRLLRPITYF